MEKHSEKKLRVSIRGLLRFCILFGVAAVSWWFFRSYLLLMVMILMVGCAVTGVVSLLLCRDVLKADFVMPQGRVGRGADFPLTLRLKNPHRFFGFSADITYRWGNVFTDYFQEKKEHLWIAPVKGCELRHSLKSQYAGRIEAKVLSFVVYDMFHLFYLRDMETAENGVVAYPMPTLAPDEEIYSCVEGFPREDESKQRGTEYNPDYEIREYVPGDELKNIHWKLTAKQNRLMVRERLKAGKRKINVLLPLTNDKQENDDLMDALYYLVQLLLEKEYPVQLFWSGVGKEFQSCFVAELGELEAVLGQILSGSGMRLPGSARVQMEMEHPGESYILVQTGAYRGAYIQ